MITAKTGDEDKVRGLDAGADDYITKPFSAMEVTARVRAVLRRTKSWDEHTEPIFRSGELVVDFASNKVTLAGEEIVLTGNEYRMLSYLARNAGRTVTLDNILSNVWGEEHVGETPLIYVNMTRLRKKLESSTENIEYILTRPGIGYTMVKKRNQIIILPHRQTIILKGVFQYKKTPLSIPPRSPLIHVKPPNDCKFSGRNTPRSAIRLKVDHPILKNQSRCWGWQDMCGMSITLSYKNENHLVGIIGVNSKLRK